MMSKYLVGEKKEQKKQDDESIIVSVSQAVMRNADTGNTLPVPSFGPSSSTGQLSEDEGMF